MVLYRWRQPLDSEGVSNFRCDFLAEPWAIIFNGVFWGGNVTLGGEVEVGSSALNIIHAGNVKEGGLGREVQS